MFTGLIESTEKIINFSRNEKGALLNVSSSFSNEVTIGDSISINGMCLTVVNIGDNFLEFEVSKETLNIANFDNIKVGNVVNIERAMRADGRFDGHIVSGHIDGIAKITKISKDGFSYNFEFSADNNILKYVVKKGSIAINGISLTICDASNSHFNVEIIPHTLLKTNLQYAKVGDFVNIETDIFARYVEKFLYLNKNNLEKSNISFEMLKDNGYI